MIIALDGLEPTLVGQTMHNLLQAEHGIVNVDVFPLMTPLIWATFLTGTDNNGVTISKYSSRIGEKIGRVTYSLGEKLTNIVGYERSMKIMSTLGNVVDKVYTPKQYTREDLTQPTIFDMVDKAIALDVPAYNENPIYLNIRRNTALAINHQYPENDVVNEIWSLFHKEYDDCLDALSKEWTLFMVHFCVTDIIGHLYWDRLEQISECYRIMNEKVGEITQKIPNSMVLIISDHGMQRGIHSHQAFYSVNKQLNLQSPNISDFYHIIGEEWLNSKKIDRSLKPLRIRVKNPDDNTAQQDKERVLKHLKELGYF
jgi:hypothetical protein